MFVKLLKRRWCYERFYGELNETCLYVPCRVEKYCAPRCLYMLVFSTDDHDLVQGKCIVYCFFSILSLKKGNDGSENDCNLYVGS